MLQFWFVSFNHVRPPSSCTSFTSSLQTMKSSHQVMGINCSNTSTLIQKLRRDLYWFFLQRQKPMAHLDQSSKCNYPFPVVWRIISDRLNKTRNCRTTLLKSHFGSLKLKAAFFWVVNRCPKQPACRNCSAAQWRTNTYKGGKNLYSHERIQTRAIMLKHLYCAQSEHIPQL